MHLYITAIRVRDTIVINGTVLSKLSCHTLFDWVNKYGMNLKLSFLQDHKSQDA